MAEYSGFFNAKQNEDGTYDRIYEASDFAQYFSLMVSDGVFKDKKNEYLQVRPKDGAMKVIVNAGWGFIDGYWYHNQSEVVLEVPVNTDFLTTKQAIVLVLDFADRKIKLDVFSNYNGRGKFTLAGKKYIILGYVTLAAGQTNISWKDITDTRYDDLHCGAVSGLATDVDVATMFQNVKDSFDTWFDGIKDQLDTDQAGHLQLQVDDIDNRVTDNTEKVTTLQNDMIDVKYKLSDGCVLFLVSVKLGLDGIIEGNRVSKITVALGSDFERMISLGYEPVLTVVKGTGNNNVQNYYMDVRSENKNGKNIYTLYTEWRNFSSKEVKATALVGILLVKQ